LKNLSVSFRAIAKLAVAMTGAALLLVADVSLAANAPAEPRITFSNSIGPLPVQAAGTMRVLQARDQTQTLEFGIALQMRNFAQMQERVARGEIIARDELERVYLPLPADYDALRQWLVGEGFTVTQDDPSRLCLFVQGTLARIQRSLQVELVTVTVEGTDYPAANTQPSLPVRLATPVLGINGLQPFRHRHKHSVFSPLTANHPPFLVSEILAAYNAKNLGVTGSGQKIAILIDTVPKNSDLTNFWANNNIPQSLTNIETVNVNGGTLPAASGEETLDVEWTSGVAPAAKIRIYASRTLNDTDLDKCFQRIINDLPSQPQMHQLSISLGLGETYSTAAQFATDTQLLATIASGGVSTFVSSGDGGSTPDSNGGSTGPLQVEYYASDPNVTAVGGTSLYVNSATGVRTNEVAWSGSGGGTSVQFNRPAWQTGSGVPAGTKRLVPDVCLPADPNTGAYVYLGGVQQYGGTSWSAPAWAGFCALINEARAKQSKPPMGLLNPSLYPLIGSTNFFDVTTGNNATTTSAGKYAAVINYDQVTGIGAPNVSNLLNTLAGLAIPAPAITSFSPLSGVENTSVIISGSNFISVASVSFNGVSAAFTVNSPAQITVAVPAGATTSPLSVTTPGGTAISATTFTVIPGPPAPSITGFSPLYGLTNASITISGLAFTNVSSVTFNGSAASFGVNSSTQIVATVPATATTGPISVVTASGTATSSSSFTVLGGDGMPLIASFTPASGAVSSAVVITGSNFMAVSGIAFNGVTAGFVTDSATQITATVPAGATTGSISVTNSYGTGTSSSAFIIVVAPVSSVVISQIYGGGGNAGAPYQNDFVELFNRGTSAADLGAWSVQYAGAIGTTWSKINLSGTLQPGHYYLVQGASGGTVGAALPTPDATGSINLSATKGKVALMGNQTVIASGTSSPVGLASLMDFVGFGSADAFEGSGPTPAPSATTSALRNNGGATDSGDNAADFSTGTPTPRNSGVGNSVVDLAITKSHPGNFTQGETGDTYTITVSNPGGLASSGAVSVVDTLPAGLTATAISGSGWTTTLGTLTATRSDALAAGASYPPVLVSVNVSASAPASVINTATVSGGGDANPANNTANDPTTINPSGGGGGTSYTGVLAGWDVSGQTGFGVSPLAPATNAPNLTVVGLTRGSGVGTAGTAATKAWGGTGFNDATAAAAVTANHLATFGVIANTGYKVSLAAVSRFDYRRSSSGPPNGVLQYQLGAGGFVDLTNLSFSVSTSSGGSLGPIDLSGIAALQNVSAGTAITFRIVSYGASSSGGTWYIWDLASSTAPDLALQGTIAPVNAAGDLALSLTHAGNFTQGDSGDTYTLTITNIGATASSGTVTVTDALPAGLTATAISGSGWNGTLNPLSCTRSDALAAGASYPPITLTVSVATNAPLSVTNTASVSGGNDANLANNTASDPTIIIALTPSQAWRLRWFGTTNSSGSAADTAIAAADGMPNLLKYALGLNPLIPAASPVAGDISTGHLRLTTPKNPDATDITLLVEVAGDLAALWTTNGTTLDQNTPALLQVHANAPVSATDSGYIRLHVTRP
jgi:kumamolisin